MSGCFKYVEGETRLAPYHFSTQCNLHFEMMCYDSGLALGDVLGQHKNKFFHPIYSPNITLNCANKNYITFDFF